MITRELMHTDLTTVSPDTPLPDLLCNFDNGNSRLLYVVDTSGRLTGVITSFDLIKAMLPSYLDSNLAGAVAEDQVITAHEFAKLKAMTARDIQITEFAALKPEHSMLKAQAIIREKGVNALPVVDAAGRPVGEITRKEVLKFISHLCSSHTSK